MRRPFSTQWLAVLLAASFLSATTYAAPQQQGQQQPTSQQQQTAASQDQQAQGPVPVQQQADPNVKPGSKQDVNAIGNRNVGHGLNFYSLEHEIALGKQLAQ